MAKNDKEKYWWIKLETNFFYQNAIDFLMSQKNGSEYVVLYQMLCLKTANTNGKFLSEVGDIIVKYDIDKIQRDTKYFSRDTIVVALELYRKLDLIYEEKDGIIAIKNHQKYIGFQTGAAKRMAEKRTENNDENGEQSRNNLGTNVPKSIELRDKSLNTRNKDLKESYISSNSEEYSKVSEPSSNKIITRELIQKIYDNNSFKKFNPEIFFNYFELKDWKFPNGNFIPVDKLLTLMNLWEQRQIEFDAASNKNQTVNKPDWIDEYVREIQNMEG